MLEDLYYSTNLINPANGQILWDSESGCLVQYDSGTWHKFQVSTMPLVKINRLERIETLFEKLK